MSGIVPDVNIGPSVLIANWIEASIAIIFVILRIHTQINVLRRVHPEDYIIVAALLFQLVNTSILTVAIHHGVGQHMQYLTFEQRVNAMRYEFLSQPFGITAAALARISLAVLLVKFCVASKAWIWTVWTIIWMQVILNAVTVFIIFLQCQPIQTLWDPNVVGKCWTPQVQVVAGYTLGVINSIHDLLLLLLPIYIIRSLTLQLRAKIILSMVLCTSVFSFIASIGKTIELSTLGNREDFTYQTTKFIIWLTIETYTIICACSVPSFRPLFLSLTKRSTRHNRGVPRAIHRNSTCGHSRISSDLSQCDSLFNSETLTTVITLPQAVREGPERDLEKNATIYIETSPVGTMTSTLYTAKEIQQRWNPGIAAMETSEYCATHKEEIVAKPEKNHTPD